MGTERNTDIEELLQAVLKLPPLSPKEREWQAISFAYGNLSATTNHRPDRGAFRNVVLARGIIDGEAFDAWADLLEWR